MQLLERIVRYLPGILVVVAVLSLISQGSRGGSDAEEEGPPRFGGTGLAGWWEWVESRSGGEVVRPASSADSLVLVIGAYGSYRERVADSIFRSGYGFAQGSLSQLHDSVFVVLVMDSSNFFPRTNGHHAVAIRHMTPDSLIVSGTGNNATLYTFVRARR